MQDDEIEGGGRYAVRLGATGCDATLFDGEGGWVCSRLRAGGMWWKSRIDGGCRFGIFYWVELRAVLAAIRN